MTAPTRTDAIMEAVRGEAERRRKQLDGRTGLQEVQFIVKFRRDEPAKVLYAERSETEL